jgi:hypothetical protein
MSLLRRLLATLLARLRPARVSPAQPARHIVIGSLQRRYPGRTPAMELRRNQGWIAIAATQPHRDRRA